MPRRTASDAAAALPCPPPASVTATRIDIVERRGGPRDAAHRLLGRLLRPVAGARLGERLGVGAHLAALRRTRSGDFTLDDAIDARRALEARPGERAAAR